MPRTFLSLAAAVLAVGLLAGAKPANKLETVDKLPDGLSKEVAAVLNADGHRIRHTQAPVVDVWFAKSVPVKADFKPGLAVKYPFSPGELVGAMRVEKGATFTDFRGQEMKPGVYTMRYDHQPQDGNHIGTSELSDFIIALPAKMDADPKPIGGADKRHQQSAKSVGSTHPAIFSLLPAEKEVKTQLEHNEDKEFWILSTSVAGDAKGKKSKVPVRMIVIGKGEE